MISDICMSDFFIGDRTGQCGNRRREETEGDAMGRQAETGGMWPQVKEPQGWRPPPAAGRGQEASSLGLSEGARPCQCLDFRLLASRTVREKISVVLSHPVWRNLLQQPRDTNPFCFEPWLMDQETRPGSPQTQAGPQAPAWRWLKSHSVWKIVLKSAFPASLQDGETWQLLLEVRRGCSL